MKYFVFKYLIKINRLKIIISLAYHLLIANKGRYQNYKIYII
jgi:hypothetical protein